MRKRQRSRAALQELKVVGHEGFHHVVAFNVAEQMRLLVTRTGDWSGKRAIAIVAVNAGEGSSFVARSLASVASFDSGREVVLVEFGATAAASLDADYHRPKGLELANRPAQRTNIDCMSIVTAPAILATERSAYATSPQLAEEIDTLRSENDVTIFDLPAISSDASVLQLASLADEVILVVRSGVTSASDIRQVVRDLGTVSVSGVVLNDFTSSVPERLLNQLGAA